MSKKKAKAKTVRYMIQRELKEPEEKLSAQMLIRLCPSEAEAVKAKAAKDNTYVSRLLRKTLLKDIAKWKAL